MGEVGLRPHDYKALSWDEVDCILHGNVLRQQYASLLPRQLAWEAYTFRQMNSEKPQFIDSPELYWPLPLLDKPRVAPAASAGADPAFLARIAARLGHPVTLLD